MGSKNVAQALSADLEGQKADLVVTFDGNTADTSIGIILVSPDGTNFKLTASDAGAVTLTEVV